MKKFLLLFALFLFGCQAESDEYYVKYSINSDHYQFGGKLELFLNDADGQLELLVNTNELVETIIGPVPYGFNAEMLARDEDGDNKKLYAEILVSKNGGPFTLKAIDGSDVARSFVTLEYEIDF